MTQSNVLQNATIRPLFPTPLASGNVPDITLCDRLDEAILDMERLRLGIFEGSTFTTEDDLHALDGPFSELNDLVMREANLFMDWLKLKRDGHYIAGMWANVTDSNHRHPVHIHPNSFLSGVVYVRTPPKCGTISFVDPRSAARVFEPNYHELNDFNSGVASYQPQKGNMFMWPSWLPHGVDRGFSEDGEKRIVIAFNIQMIGVIETRTAKMDLI